LTRHSVSFSGGKDSTAMLLRMLELNMPVDQILFFDTGWEFPQLLEHVDKVERYIGREITRLKYKQSFDHMLSEHIVNARNGEKKTGYGWARPNSRWCTRLKLNMLKQKAQGCLEYIGIAADEAGRIESSAELQRPNARYPLVDWGWTEADCLACCYEKGFDWSGLYHHFKRVSCFCCPLQRESELRALYLYYPKLWKRLEVMDARTRGTFKEDRSIESFRLQFEWEQLQITFNF